MLPLTAKYDDFIDRQKLTEQKNCSSAYNSSATKVDRNNYNVHMKTFQKIMNEKNYDK